MPVRKRSENVGAFWRIFSSGRKIFGIWHVPTSNLISKKLIAQDTSIIGGRKITPTEVGRIPSRLKTPIFHLGFGFLSLAAGL